MIKLFKSKWALFIGLNFMGLSFFSAQDVMASSSIFYEIKAADDQIRISGKIVDTAGEPLIGATIVVKGNESKGTITDINGNFSLVVDSDCVILISSVGYVDKEITASKLQGMTIILEEASELVDEVVVVGYGTKKKRDLTGSIGSISAKELKKYLLTRTDDPEGVSLFQSRTIGEDWMKLVSLIRNDENIPNRPEILNTITGIKNNDAKEAALRRFKEYAYIRKELYPKLRAVNFEFHLHRREMVKDTIHTTVIDTVYMDAIKLLDRIVNGQAPAKVIAK